MDKLKALRKIKPLSLRSEYPFGILNEDNFYFTGRLITFVDQEKKRTSGGLDRSSSVLVFFL